MNDKRIKTCYIDDVIDTGLSLYLHNFPGIHNFDITPCKEDNAASLINLIIENGYKIVIIDSDLANGNNPLLTTGQQLELLLTQKFPFVFAIVLTSHLEKEYSNYLKKFNSRLARKSGIDINCYYDQTIKPILEFAIEKHKRNLKTLDTELTEEKGINSAEKNQVIWSFNNSERIVLSKDNLDRIIDLFGEIKSLDENK